MIWLTRRYCIVNLFSSCAIAASFMSNLWRSRGNNRLSNDGDDDHFAKSVVGCFYCFCCLIVSEPRITTIWVSLKYQMHSHVSYYVCSSPNEFNDLVGEIRVFHALPDVQLPHDAAMNFRVFQEISDALFVGYCVSQCP